MSNVYFIQSGTRVKIGVATNVRDRLSGLQIGSPEPLHVLAVIENAGLSEERELHAKFARHHIRGEWFSLDGDLAAFVADLPAYEHKADTEAVARRFLTRSIVRIDRHDRWIKSGTLYKKYMGWCSRHGQPCVERERALVLFGEWFGERDYRISGGTALRPSWTVWGAAIAA